jgi:LacI family transcriptional regulator
MKRPTQNDVARLAGVSRATVSYVINDRHEGPIMITEETRQKILASADQLGYEPDAAAQSLRMQVSRSIGVLIPDLHNPHYWQIVTGVEQILQTRGFDLLLTSTSLLPDREYSALRSLLRRRVDGLILNLTYSDQDQQEIKTIINRRNPVVTLGEAHIELDSVSPDERNGCLQLFHYLFDLGHRRIAYIHGVAHHPLGLPRLETYQQMMSETGQRDNKPNIEYCGARISDGYQAAQRLLDRDPRPTAIMVINDLLAIGVMHAVAERSLRIPEDISIAGFDDIVQSAFLNPALTTVQMQAEEMGRSAARLLFERMADPERAPQHRIIPTLLVKRASTGPVPISARV